MEKVVEQDLARELEGSREARKECLRSFDRLLATLYPVHEAESNRYIIYSEKEKIFIVATLSDRKGTGVYTVLIIEQDRYTHYPFWLIPTMAARALKSYIKTFVDHVMINVDKANAKR
jgi:hypothetical protein